jgi:outer membrane immunogenic protein
MKAKVVAAATLMALAAFGSASAADLPMPAPVYKAPPLPPPVYNWTGCYVGGGGGYGWWNQDSQVVTRAAGVPLAAQVTNGGKGWFGQGQAGCDYQFNMPLGTWNLPVVIGVFGDWEGGSIRGTQSTAALVGSENESSTWAVGGRAGYLVTPRFLTYFDGGYTQARFDQINYNLSAAGGGPSGFSLPAQTYNGWFVGSGFEYAFDWLPIPGLFLKTEYRYAQYNTATPNFLFMNAPAAISLNTTKFTQFVSTELVWRFNWWGGHY